MTLIDFQYVSCPVGQCSFAAGIDPWGVDSHRSEVAYETKLPCPGRIP